MYAKATIYLPWDSTYLPWSGLPSLSRIPREDLVQELVTSPGPTDTSRKVSLASVWLLTFLIWKQHQDADRKHLGFWSLIDEDINSSLTSMS